MQAESPIPRNYYRTARQNMYFLILKTEKEAFIILNSPAREQKAPSCALDLSKHPFSIS
jgi:hypothetical protein